jgi:protein-tyrosine phosphatase
MSATPSPYRITAVCLGNICRSPMAEAVLRARVIEAGLTHVTIDSAGTGGWHAGGDADPRTRATLRARGYDLDHTARQFRSSWFAERDLIVVMDSANYRDVLDLRAAAQADTPVRMLRSFDPALAHLAESHPELDVPDPYYAGGFDEVLDVIEAASASLLASVYIPPGV